MEIIKVLFLIAIFAIGVYAGYTAGRAKGFEECWKEFVKKDEAGES